MVRHLHLSFLALVLVILSVGILTACASPAPPTSAPATLTAPTFASPALTATPELSIAPATELPTLAVENTPTPSASVTNAATATGISTTAASTLDPAAVTAPASETTAAGRPTPVLPESFIAFDADFFADECPLFVGDNEIRKYECDFGEYYMLHKTATTRFSYVDGEYDDAVIEANGFFSKGTGKYEYGVVFRAKTDGTLYYVFTVTQDGKYNVALYQNEKYTDLIPYTASSLVKTDADNYFKIVMRGSRFDFFLNDEYLDSVTDATIARGVVGYFFYNGEPSTEVGFDQLTISTFTPPPPPPTPNGTLTPTSTPTVLPTEEPTYPAWSANFTTGCDLFEGDSEIRQYGCANGTYVMHHKQATTRYAYYDENYEDAVISAQGHWVSGTGAHEYGIVLRANTEGTLYYVFTVTADAKYNIALYKDNKYTNIVPYTLSPIVKIGTETNRFRIVMRGSHFTFYLNDELIEQVDDATIASGKVGLFFYNEKPDAQVAFDALSVSTFAPTTPAATGSAPQPTRSDATPVPVPTRAPTQAPTRAPTRVPTVAIKPGVYVTNVRMEPRAPKYRQPVTFFVTFVNSTGKAQSYKWLVEIWEQDTNKRNPYGQGDALEREIPAGMSERATGDSFKVAGGGPCVPFRARVVFTDDQGRRVPFQRTNGTDFWVTFQVCP